MSTTFSCQLRLGWTEREKKEGMMNDDDDDEERIIIINKG